MLRVTTWNLDGLDDAALDVRTEAACFELLLRDRPADVVCLQEVVDRAFHAHLRHHFAAAGYAWAPTGPDWEGESGCMIFSRATLKGAWRHPFPSSQMGRYLLGAQLEHEGREHLVCTAHLESLRVSRRERVRQAREVVEVLERAEVPALFAGDTNLRGDEGVEVLDAWELAGRPADRRDTWDARRPRLRFDRVWLGGSGWEVKALRLLGRHPVGEGLWPSDHLGLEVDLAFRD